MDEKQKPWDRVPPTGVTKPVKKTTKNMEYWFRRKQLLTSVVQCKECEGWMYYSQEFCSWCNNFK